MLCSNWTTYRQVVTALEISLCVGDGTKSVLSYFPAVNFYLVSLLNVVFICEAFSCKTCGTEL